MALWDDPLDPFGLGRPALPGTPAPVALPPMDAPEMESTLSKLGGKVMGGLGYAGRVLDKTFGGRAIRGVLGGKPREALSILPFSDTLGITDEAEKVHGRDLLGYSPDDKSWGALLGGMGVDMALDPALYLTLGAGALSRGGQVARAAGVLPATTAARATTTLGDLAAAARAAGKPIDALLNTAAQARKIPLAEIEKEALGGVAGLGVPFMRPSVLLGTGQGGADFMSGLGQVGSFLGNKLPLTSHIYQGALEPAGRYLGAWFDPTVKGFTSREGQAAARMATETEKALIAEGKNIGIEMGQQLQKAGKGGTGSELRRLTEGVSPTGPMDATEAAVAQQLRSRYQDLLKRAQDVGMPVQPLEDNVIQFASRQWRPLDKASKGALAGRQPLGALGPGMEAREDLWKNFLEGTEGINRAAVDPLLSGPGRTMNPLQASARLRQEYLGMGPAEEATLFALNQNKAALTPAEEAMRLKLQATWDQSHQLARRLEQMDPAYALSATDAQPLRAFGNHPLQDLITYEERFGRHQGAATATHDLLAKTAIDTGGAVAPQGSVSLADVLKSAGLTGPGGAQTFANARGVTLADLDRFAVPGNIASDIGQVMKKFQTPESVSTALGGFDWLTNLAKAWQTAPWAGFHVRNWLSGIYNNLLKSPEAASLGTQAQVKGMLAGKAIPGAAAIPHLPTGLSDLEATQELAKQLYAHNVMGHGGPMTREAVGAAGAPRTAGTLEELLGQVPGYTPKTLGGAMGELGSPNWNPLDVQAAPIRAGREVGDVVEGVNRGSLFLALRRQGYTDAEAARSVLESHFDYTRSGLTDVERNVMRRLVPFYRYTRGNVPLQLGELATKPGGLNAQVARAADELHQQTGFLPDYLGQGLAVPTGEEQGGTKRFLTKTDLPIEQAFDLLKGGPDWLKESLMGVGGQLNPMLKGPLEYATGKQFFTGRDTADLYKTTPTELTEAAVMNSPWSRFLTTARTLSDPRKWENPLAIPVNLATGVRLSDVDMEKQRSIAAREVIQKMLQGQPEIGKFQQIYVKPGQEGLLSPSDIELLRLNKTLEQQALQAARAKQKAGI